MNVNRCVPGCFMFAKVYHLRCWCVSMPTFSESHKPLHTQEGEGFTHPKHRDTGIRTLSNEHRPTG